MELFFVPFFFVQLVLPLRHHFIKGDVLFTEEGHRLSWRMMLRERVGRLNIKIVNTNGQVVYSENNFSGKVIDTSNLAAGFYCIIITTDNLTTIKKAIK